MGAQFIIPNGPMQTTAAAIAVTTGTAIKTMLQVKASATLIARVKAWGISFDGFAAAAPGKIELIETDVAATVTASVAADLTKANGDALMCGDPTTNLIQVGTAATGYTATAEGTITATRDLEGPMFLAPSTQPFVMQYPLGDEPIIQVAKFARIRVTFAAAVNCYCWMKIEI